MLLSIIGILSLIAWIISEDNASFGKLLDADKQKWNEKYWWIAKQEEEAKQKLLAIQASSDNKLNNMVKSLLF